MILCALLLCVGAAHAHSPNADLQPEESNVSSINLKAEKNAKKKEPKKNAKELKAVVTSKKKKLSPEEKKRIETLKFIEKELQNYIAHKQALWYRLGSMTIGMENYEVWVKRGTYIQVKINSHGMWYDATRTYGGAGNNLWKVRIDGFVREFKIPSWAESGAYDAPTTETPPTYNPFEELDKWKKGEANIFTNPELQTDKKANEKAVSVSSLNKK